MLLNPALADDATPAATLLAMAEQKVASDDPTVFLLDEVGRLARYDPTAVSWLRDLGQAGAWLVYTGTIKDWHTVVRWALTSPGSSFGNDVNAWELGPWDEPTALTFIVGTAANLHVDIASTGTGRHVIDLVGTWPFYLQVVGDALVRGIQTGEFRLLDHDALPGLVERKLLDEWAAHFEGRWAEIGEAGKSALLSTPARDAGLLTPGQRNDLRDAGFLAPGDEWLVDRPFYEWISRNSTSLKDRIA